MNAIDWSRTVFVLLGADAFARHTALPILQRIIAEGFRPISYRPIWTRPTELDEFYEKNIRTAWDAYRFRCVDLAFAYGPMVGLLVEDTEADRSAGSHEHLRRLKGDSDPLKAEKGTIRGDIRPINQVLNMIHISDTPEDAQYEVTIFFPSEEPIQLPADSFEELSAVCRLLMPVEPETRGFDEVLGGLRSKAILAVWEHISQEGREVVQAWEEEGGVYRFAELDAGKELAKFLPGGTDHPLAPVMECEFQPDHPREDLSRVRLLLGAYGVQVDRWEELVLTTSMFFRPVRRGDA